MIPYYRGLVFDNTNKYGIMNTDLVFGFGPLTLNSYVNSTEPLEWIFKKENIMPRSKQADYHSSRSFNVQPDYKIQKTVQRNKNKIKNDLEDSKRKSKGKGHKCIFKEQHNLMKIKRRKKFIKLHKKYLMPIILGLLAAKSLLLPIALKTIALMSAKGLMMSFFSTVLSSLLSLKAILDHSHSYGYQNRKEDTKTQVEIVHIPKKSNDHYYYDEYHKRNDVYPTNKQKEERKKTNYFKAEIEKLKSKRNKTKK